MIRKFYIFIIAILIAQNNLFGQAVTFDPNNDFISFDGIDDYHELSSIAFGGIIINSGTIEFWMKPNDISSKSMVFNMISEVTYSGMNFWMESGSLYVGLFSHIPAIPWFVPETWNTTWFKLDATLQQDKWTHIALVMDGTAADGLKLYIDGSLALTGRGRNIAEISYNTISSTYKTVFPVSLTNPVTEITNSASLTKYNNPRDYFYNGQVSLLRVWGTPRSETEIINNANIFTTITDRGDGTPFNPDIITFLDNDGLIRNEGSGEVVGTGGGDPTPTMEYTWLGTTSSDLYDSTNWENPDAINHLDDYSLKLDLSDITLSNYPDFSTGLELNLYSLTTPVGFSIDNNSDIGIAYLASINGVFNNLNNLDSDYLMISSTGDFTNSNTLNVFANTLIDGSLLLQEQSQTTLNGDVINNGTVEMKSSEAGTASLITYSSFMGDVSVERYVAYSGYGTISSPTNSKTDVFTGHTLMSHRESKRAGENTPFAIVSIDSSTDLIKGDGYVFILNTDETDFNNNNRKFTFNGEPNYGDFTWTLTNTIYNEAGEGYGWNLLGNPYPSAITWTNLETKLNAVGTDINGSMYLFDGVTSSWKIFNPTLPTSESEIDNIPIGQAFFVQLAEDVNGIDRTESYTITNNIQTHSNENVNFNDVAEVVAKKSTTEDIDYPDFYFEIIASANNMTDKVIYHQRAEATNGFDNKYDSYKLMSWNEGSPNIFFYSGDVKTSIQQDFDADLVRMGVSVPGAITTVNLSLSHLTSFEDVYIEDLEEGLMVNLKDQNYSFQTTENDMERFVVHLLKKTLTIENKLDKVSIYTTGNSIFIKDLKISQKVDIALYDLNGREYIRDNFISDDLIYELSTDLTPGNYIIKLSVDNLILKSKLINIRN